MRKASLVIGMIVVVFLLFGFLLISCSSSVPVTDNGDIETSTEIVPSADTSEDCPSAKAVKGIVIDEQGNPVENATVRLQTTTLDTKTNAKANLLYAVFKKKALLGLLPFLKFTSSKKLTQQQGLQT